MPYKPSKTRRLLRDRFVNKESEPKDITISSYYIQNLLLPFVRDFFKGELLDVEVHETMAKDSRLRKVKIDK